MTISRSILVNVLMTITATIFERDTIHPQRVQPVPVNVDHKELIKQLYPPPLGVNYDSNPSVFGKILKGELPSYAYQESKELLAFRDRSPKAKLHALATPKKHIKSVKTLKSLTLT